MQIICNTQMHFVGEMQSIVMLHEMAHLGFFCKGVGLYLSKCNNMFFPTNILNSKLHIIFAY